MTDATVVIATFRRPELLRDTLASLAASLRGSHRTPEILVIAPAADEATRGVCAESPVPVRFLAETGRGLSAARNQGIREAKADLIAFLDDDVEIADGWLDALLDGCEAHAADVVGGRVLPHGGLPEDVLRWLPPSHHDIFGTYDRGTKPQPVADWVIGCNFAVRRSTIELFGGFREELGRQGRRLIANEEVEFCLRVVRGGGRIVYVPGALLHHKVQARYHRKFVRATSRGQGLSDARMNLLLGDRRKHARSIAHAARFYALSPWRWVRARGDEQRRTRLAIDANYHWGYLTWWRP